MSDIIERLRGIYRVPITDGLGRVEGNLEPDNETEFVRQFPSPPIQIEAAKEIERLRKIEAACKRLAFIVRKSGNSGPLSKDPTQEAEAWRALRIALGEGYDERGNLVPVEAKL